MPASHFTVLRDRVDQPPAPGALKGAVVALGNFDGVHRGHRAVIGMAQARARALGKPAAVMTFEPHPRVYFKPGTIDRPVASDFRINTLDDKLRLLAGTGLDGTIVMAFDETLAGLGPEDFVARVLVERFAVSGVTTGDDFRFGKERTGTPEFLRAEGQRLGFAVDVAPALLEGDERVSSGAVRSALVRGDAVHAGKLLGYPWFASGKVEKGDARGRDLGYPTANIRIDPACGLKHGVYAVRVGVDDVHYDGVANYGRRPMFDNGDVLLESYLFDFSGDLYGKTIDVAFFGYLRPELKFRSTDDLVDRMNEDSRMARKLLIGAGNVFPPLASRTVLA